MRLRRLRCVFALCLLPVAACSDGDGGPDPYTLAVEGSVRVSGENDRTLRSGEHKVAIGDRLRVTEGSAVLALPDRSSLELRTGRSEATVEVAATPTVVDGDALALAGSKGLRVRAGAAVLRLTTDAAARLRRSSGLTVGVYRGAVEIDALGQQLETPALRQAAVSDTGALPVRPVPLVYDRTNPDPWDVRFLGDAIDLGSHLERRSRALTAQAETSEAAQSSLAEIVPPLGTTPGFSAALVDPERSLGETVVGASIVLAGDGAFETRWDQVFGLRQEGADWGLVAVDQRARRADVFGVLDGVFDRVAGRAVVSGGLGRRTTPTTAPTGSGGSGGGPPTTAPSSTTTTTAPPSQPQVTIPPISLLPGSPTTTTVPGRSPTNGPAPTTTTTVPFRFVPDPVRELLLRLLEDRGRPTRSESVDIASEDDRADDRGGRRRTEAVLHRLPWLRPVRGEGLLGAGREHLGDVAGAGADA